jgi:hypothetical protein
MSRYHFMIALLMITILQAPNVARGANPPLEKAFLGLPWGADIREQSGFKMLHGKDQLRFYTKPGTVRTVRGIRVRQVVYGTYQYRFFAAFLILDSPEAFAELRDYMESRYGQPKTAYQVASDQTTHQWRHRQIKMKLKSASGGQRLKLAFYYTPLSREVNEALVERQQDKARWFPIERDKKPEALPILEF